MTSTRRDFAAMRVRKLTRRIAEFEQRLTQSGDVRIDHLGWRPGTTVKRRILNDKAALRRWLIEFPDVLT